MKGNDGVSLGPVPRESFVGRPEIQETIGQVGERGSRSGTDSSPNGDQHPVQKHIHSDGQANVSEALPGQAALKHQTTAEYGGSVKYDERNQHKKCCGSGVIFGPKE